MSDFEITDLNSYTQVVNELAKSRGDLILFRGQCNDDDLLPGVGRHIKNDSGILVPPNIGRETEQNMLDEFKKKLPNFIQETFSNDWDLLAIAQHHGMATRLLDWTQNPLIALWFACSSPFVRDTYSVIWVISTYSSSIFKFASGTSPFVIDATKIISPNWVAKRIANQSGLFTIHKPSIESENLIFRNLNEDSSFEPALFRFIIPKNKRKEIVKELNVYGINSASVFPDLDGLCKSLNRHYLDK
jgi:hypothetical protein